MALKCGFPQFRIFLTVIDMTQWANTKLSSRNLRIDNFKDPSLATGIYLVNLVDAVHPGVVMSKIISPGVSMEERMLNAKYLQTIISLLMIS